MHHLASPISLAAVIAITCVLPTAQAEITYSGPSRHRAHDHADESDAPFATHGRRRHWQIYDEREGRRPFETAPRHDHAPHGRYRGAYDRDDYGDPDGYRHDDARRHDHDRYGRRHGYGYDHGYGRDYDDDYARGYGYGPGSRYGYRYPAHGARGHSYGPRTGGDPRYVPPPPRRYPSVPPPLGGRR